MAEREPEMTPERKAFLEGADGFGDGEIVTDEIDQEEDAPIGAEPEVAPEESVADPTDALAAQLIPGVEEEDPWHQIKDQYTDPNQLQALIDQGKNVQQMMTEAHRRNEEAAQMREDVRRSEDDLRYKRKEVDDFLHTIQSQDLDEEEAVQHLRRFRARDAERPGSRGGQPDQAYQQLETRFTELQGQFNTTLQTLATDRVEGQLDGLIESNASDLSPLERKMLRETVRNQVFSEIQEGRMNGANLKTRTPSIFKEQMHSVRRDSAEDLKWRLARLKAQETGGIPAGGPRAAAPSRPAPARGKKPGPQRKDQAARLRLAKQVMERQEPG